MSENKWPHIATKADYERYEQAFAKGTEGYEIVSSGDEQGFSWVPCDICNRELGGTRYSCALANPGVKACVSDLSICADCMYYAAYDQLDDMTMLEIGE